MNTLLALFALVSLVGDARAERDRKARAALALAAKPVALPGYAEAYRRAVERREPLVLYVGCGGRHPIDTVPNAVVAVAPELSGYAAGTVVIAYPHAGRLFVHAALKCSDSGAPVASAADDARKRIAAPPTAKSDAAPVPLDWNL